MVIAILSVFILSHSPSSYADTELDLRILEARDIFNEFTLISEFGIPERYISEAKAILLFPNTVKGGFLFALRYGRGVALVKDATTGTWSAPAFMRISGGSFGLQAGADWTDHVIIGKSDTAIRSFLHRRFALTGNLAATAGPWGRHSEIMTDWNFGYTFVTYSRSKGLFAAAAIDGVVFSYDTQANEAYYGEGTTVEQILFQNRVNITPAAGNLIDAIEAYSAYIQQGAQEEKTIVRREPPARN